FPKLRYSLLPAAYAGCATGAADNRRTMRLQLTTIPSTKYCTFTRQRPRYRTRRPSCQRTSSLSFLSTAGCSLRICLYSSVVARCLAARYWGAKSFLLTLRAPRFLAETHLARNGQSGHCEPRKG